MNTERDEKEEGEKIRKDKTKTERFPTKVGNLKKTKTKTERFPTKVGNLN